MPKSPSLRAEEQFAAYRKPKPAKATITDKARQQRLDHIADLRAQRLSRLAAETAALEEAATAKKAAKKKKTRTGNK